MDGRWRDAYSVGHEMLDRQHQGLLQLCKDVERLIGDPSPEANERLHEDLAALMDYSRTHFTTEEQVLDAAGYPGLPAQVEEHFAYVERLSHMLIAAMDQRLDRSALYGYLSQWWVRHILESDMDYKAYVGGS